MADTLPVVFVVDDDEAVREALGNLLRSTGLRVETFAAAPDFLAVELPRAPCCLILDVEAARVKRPRLPGEAGGRQDRHSDHLHPGTATFL